MKKLLIATTLISLASPLRAQSLEEVEKLGQPDPFFLCMMSLEQARTHFPSLDTCLDYTTREGVKGKACGTLGMGLDFKLVEGTTGSFYVLDAIAWSEINLEIDACSEPRAIQNAMGVVQAQRLLTHAYKQGVAKKAAKDRIKATEEAEALAVENKAKEADKEAQRTESLDKAKQAGDVVGTFLKAVVF
jgi:hypothetical protein